MEHMRPELTEFVISTIAGLCQADSAIVLPESVCVDLGLDSMSLTTFATRLESRFDCELTEEHLVRLFEAQSVEDLVALSHDVVAWRPTREDAGVRL